MDKPDVYSGTWIEAFRRAGHVAYTKRDEIAPDNPDGVDFFHYECSTCFGPGCIRCQSAWCMFCTDAGDIIKCEEVLP